MYIWLTGEEYNGFYVTVFAESVEKAREYLKANPTSDRFDLNEQIRNYRGPPRGTWLDIIFTTKPTFVSPIKPGVIKHLDYGTG